MKINRFDVVELKSKNRATILYQDKKDKYFAEIVNAYGIVLGKRIITSNEINKVIHKKEMIR